MTSHVTGPASCPSRRRHGDEAAYHHDGCRCPVARDVTRRVRKRRAAGLHRPGRLDSTGTARRLQALAAIGWPAEVLAARLGYCRARLKHLRAPLYPAVLTSVADRVDALYDELALEIGPSTSAWKRAARSGWAPPLAWDDTDIDDPAAGPNLTGELELPAEVNAALVVAVASGHMPLDMLPRRHQRHAVRLLQLDGLTPSEIRTRLRIDYRRARSLEMATHRDAILAAAAATPAPPPTVLRADPRVLAEVLAGRRRLAELPEPWQWLPVRVLTARGLTHTAAAAFLHIGEHTVPRILAGEPTDLTTAMRLLTTALRTSSSSRAAA